MTGPLTPKNNESRQQQINDAAAQLGHPNPPQKPATPQAPAPAVSQASLQAAQHEAARTGLPQPVRAASGEIVFYIDYSGAVIPDTAAKEQLAHTGKPFVPSLQGVARGVDNQSAASVLAQESAQSSAAQDAKSASALKNLGYQQSLGAPVWVNGQMQVVTGFHSDGTPIFGYQGSSTGSAPDTVINPVTGMPYPKGVETAFDALHLGATYGPTAGINGTDRFIMAVGPTDAITGMPGTSNLYTPAGASRDTPAGADYSQSARTVTNGISQMTIAQGVQWLANLANQNRAAYDQLVSELRHAGYTGAQGEALTGGAYSETVGVAAAKAMKDLSVMQQTTGSQMGLDQFLAQRTDAVRQAAMDSYQPTARNYATSDSMMAAAKSAAQDAIGRNLTPQELSSFEQSFLGQQSAYYDQYDAASKAQKGAEAIGESAPGPTGAQPDLSGAATGLVQGGQFAQERANYSAQNYYQAIAQMFGIK